MELHELSNNLYLISMALFALCIVLFFWKKLYSKSIYTIPFVLSFIGAVLSLSVSYVVGFLISRVFGDMMYKNQKGKIINISSTNGIDTYYEYSLDYDSSKAGVINLTHNLANYYSPYVNVNCVCPGWIDTPMNKDMDIQFRKDEEDKILLKRFANPDEIASLVYFLGSDDASYINDSVIRIDGGKKC